VERDDGVLARSARGPVRPWVWWPRRWCSPAIVCVALGLIVLGRWPWWAMSPWAAGRVGGALALIGFALGGLAPGGALAGDTRTAMLAAFMLNRALAALALLPRRSGGGHRAAALVAPGSTSPGRCWRPWSTAPASRSTWSRSA